jgi:hypothetical protein
MTTYSLSQDALASSSHLTKFALVAWMSKGDTSVPAYLVVRSQTTQSEIRSIRPAKSGRMIDAKVNDF